MCNKVDVIPFQTRRQHLMQQMGQGLALITAGKEQFRNADNVYPYRQNSDFWYLSGFEEPQSWLLLDADAGKTMLFCRPKDEDREIWNGYRYGPDAATQMFGFDEAFPINELEERLPTLLGNHQQLYWHIGSDRQVDYSINKALQSLRSRPKQDVPDVFCQLRPLLDELRLVKDEYELNALRKAAKISAWGHQRAMQVVKAGMYEYELEAELLYTFVKHGARFPSFESIVASGANACTLHYNSNRCVLKDGDLVLIDAGAEWQGYAGDISRTFPVNGRFSGEQKAVYEIVLAAQQAAIDVIAPDVAWNVPSDAALKVLVQGMLDLRLLSGSVDGVIQSGTYRQFYMHGIGHWVGLDVHDVGSRYLKGQYRLFKPGMCTTVEPGLYIRPADNVPEQFQGIGIRIEDNVVVTQNGCEVYSGDVPKQIDAIEELIRES